MLVKECFEHFIDVAPVVAGESIGGSFFVLDVVEFPVLFVLVGGVVCRVLSLALRFWWDFGSRWGWRVGSWRVGCFAVGVVFGREANGVADGFSEMTCHGYGYGYGWDDLTL